LGDNLLHVLKSFQKEYNTRIACKELEIQFLTYLSCLSLYVLTNIPDHFNITANTTILTNNDIKFRKANSGLKITIYTNLSYSPYEALRALAKTILTKYKRSLRVAIRFHIRAIQKQSQTVSVTSCIIKQILSRGIDTNLECLKMIKAFFNKYLNFLIMKNVLKLGQALSKVEQKQISAGNLSFNQCQSPCQYSDSYSCCMCPPSVPVPPRDNTLIQPTCISYNAAHCWVYQEFVC